MSCPWGKIKQFEPVNLEDIISEEVARNLQAKEAKKYIQKFNDAISNAEDNIVDDVTFELPEGSSDEVIAQMLQMQFDKEYNREIMRTERNNESSKASISINDYDYSTSAQNYEFECDSEEDDREDWEKCDVLERKFTSMLQCGYKMEKAGNILRHNVVAMSGGKKVTKLLVFPAKFHAGNADMSDLKLSNKVLNSLKLKLQSNKEQSNYVYEIKDSHVCTLFGKDQYTRILLHKMINNRILWRVNGVISTGKESVILRVDLHRSYPRPKATEPLPRECVIKVFKSILCESKQQNGYITGDDRLKTKIENQTARKSLNLLAEKEMVNLAKLRRVGIPCPQVVALKQHVLVMSFIGINHVPAPKLRDANMTDYEYTVAYEEVLAAMDTLYNQVNLIHGDLSDCNILWHKKQCYFIDVDQSVHSSDENAFHLLYRDCSNVFNFFTQKDVPKMLTPAEMFKSITGHDYKDKFVPTEM